MPLSAVSGDWLPPVGDHMLKLAPRTQPTGTAGYSAYHEPSDPVHVCANGSVERLVLSGIDRHQLIGLQMREVEGDLRELGLDTPGALFAAYQLKGSDETTLEVIASPVARIEPDSTISGRKVQLRVSLASELSPDALRITARNADPQVSDIPWTVPGNNLSWSADGPWRR
jgi:hypothetical protein